MQDAERFRLDVFDAVPEDVPVGAVHQAIDEFARQGKLRTWQVVACVARAGELTELQGPTNKDARPVIASTPESQVQTARWHTLLRPWVLEVRRALFRRAGRPFESATAAARWIEASTNHMTPAKRTRLKPRYDRLMARIQPELEALRVLTGSEYLLREVAVTLLYQKPRCKVVARVRVARGSPLMTLKQAANGMAHASGFAEDAIVSWILFGQAPALEPARLTTRMYGSTLPDGTPVVRREASVELHVRDLSYQEFRRIYRALRTGWEVTRVKGLTRRDVTLKAAVDRRGGLLRKQPWSRAFWQPVADDLGYQSHQAALMAYRRLRTKLARL